MTADKPIEELSLFEDESRIVATEKLARTIDDLSRRFGHEAVLRVSILLDRNLTGFNSREDHTIHPISYFR